MRRLQLERGGLVYEVLVETGLSAFSPASEIEWDCSCVVYGLLLMLLRLVQSVSIAGTVVEEMPFSGHGSCHGGGRSLHWPRYVPADKDE